MKKSLVAVLKEVLWEYDVKKISWNRHKDFIIKRILQGNSWDAIVWLKEKTGKEELRSWLIEQKGAGLDARRIRFWEIILDIPRRTSNRWIAKQSATIWAKRTER